MLTGKKQGMWFVKLRKKTGCFISTYRKKIGISNNLTGKNLVSQIILPEKNWYLKYSYPKKIDFVKCLSFRICYKEVEIHLFYCICFDTKMKMDN